MNKTLAVITGESIMRLVITLIVAGLIYWILDWAIKATGLPDPFAKVARVILILAAVIFLINALLGIAGHGFISWR